MYIVLKMNEKPQLQAVFQINFGSRVMCYNLNQSVKDIENWEVNIILANK